MVLFDRVGHECDADFVVLSMPVRAAQVSAYSYTLIDLGVGKGFVLAFVPAKAAENTQILCDFLLVIPPKTVLYGAKMLVFCDLWSGVCAVKIGIDCFPVRSHMGVIHVTQ